MIFVALYADKRADSVEGAMAFRCRCRIALLLIAPPLFSCLRHADALSRVAAFIALPDTSLFDTL